MVKIIIAAVIISLGLFAFSYSNMQVSLLAGSTVHDTIKLRVKKEGGKDVLVVVTKPSKRCKKNSTKRGCVEVDLGDDALIPIRFSYPTWYKNYKWHFTIFEICPWYGGPSEGKRPDLDIACSTLTAAQREDFQARPWDSGGGIMPELGTGIIDLTSLESDPNKLHGFRLKDFNLNTQDYFYRIQACKDSEPLVCIWTDPPVTNKGRGRN